MERKWPPGSFSVRNRIFSWSAYNVWVNQGKTEFAKKYIYGGAEFMNPRMMTGRIVADMVEKDEEQKDPVLQHLWAYLPRYEHQEHEIEVQFCGLTLVMHLDGFTLDPVKIGEYKTGIKWNEEMVAKWEQLDWYVLGVSLKYGIRAEDIPIELVWMPTQWIEGERLPRPTGEIKVFHTRRTTRQMLDIGKKITDAFRQIEVQCDDELKSIGL